MPFKFDEINYAAVAVAGLGAFFLGALWYTALFGATWRRLAGFTDEKIKELQGQRGPAVFFGGMIVAYLVVAFVLAALTASLDIQTPIAGAALGLLVWLAVAAVGMTGHLAHDKPFGLYVIDTSFQLAFFVMMGAVLGAWR
jgi:uncharacterized protein DUF1761